MRIIGRTRSAILAPLLGWLCLIAGGVGACSSPTPAIAPVLGPNYVDLYEAHRFAEAQTAAVARAKELPRGPERERAMLVAGQSAHALSRDGEAEPWLKPLLDSGNADIAGQAATTLGLIEQRAGNNSKAIVYFQTASEKLAGDGSARALMYMGDSYSWMGQPSKARDAYVDAQGRAKADAQLKTEIGGRLSDRGREARPAQGGFSVQVGAYSSRQRAQGTADRIRAKATGQGMGDPRVIETSSAGKKVFVVQVGRFATREQADRAKVSFGEPGFTTKAAD